MCWIILKKCLIVEFFLQQITFIGHSSERPNNPTGPTHTLHVEAKNQAAKSQRLPEELCDKKCGETYRSGPGYKTISKALSVPGSSDLDDCEKFVKGLSGQLEEKDPTLVSEVTERQEKFSL